MFASFLRPSTFSIIIGGKEMVDKLVDKLLLFRSARILYHIKQLAVRQAQSAPLRTSTARIALAEVFHTWVRWEGSGSGFESSSEDLGIWKSWNFTPVGSGCQNQVLEIQWLGT